MGAAPDGSRWAGDAEHPLFGEAVAAIAHGDLAGLTALLDRAPDLVRARTASPVAATLLHHTAFNGIDALCFDAPPETPQLAALLLERGAQADAVALGDPRGTPLCWALSSWFTHAGGVQTGLTDAYLDGGARIEGLSGDGAPLGHAIGFGYTASVEHLARRGARADHLTGAAALGDVAQLRAWMRTDGSFSPQALTFTMGTRRETGRFSWPPPLDPDPAALALVTGATHGRLAVVRMLVEHGIEPDRAVSMDQTALHFAAYMGHRAVVEYLLTVGARTDMRERQFGLTAADWARETGEDDLAQRIEEHGETSR